MNGSAKLERAAADQPSPLPKARVESAGGQPSYLAWLTRSERSSIAVALAVTALAAAAFVSAAPQIPTVDLPTVAFLLALVFLAEAGTLELFDRTSYSIGVVPKLAAGMLLGVPGAILVAPAAALIRGFRRRTRWYKILFNCSNYVIATYVATTVFQAFGISLEPPNLPYLLAIAALAGFVFYLHTLLVATGMATEVQAHPLRLWSDNFRWLWPQYVVLGLMGLLLALAYDEYGIIGAAVFAIPPFMMRYVAKQYIDRTLDNVRQLRTLNEQLADEIAQRIAAEEENARLVKEAARAAALEELSRLKSEFISIASHELRTPMTTIMGFSELILTQTPQDNPNYRFLSIIHEDAVQLTALVDNLLDVSRIETGRITVHPSPVDLASVVPVVIQTLGAPAPNHILIADLAEDARWVHADPAKLNQMLTNLISNAIKYSPDGGRVLISARRDREAGNVAVSVADEGMGIPADYMDRIFDRFQRIDSPERSGIRGTGLGLYIVRQLVELHGGAVRVGSEVGQGSTFTITLPAARFEEERETPAEAHTRIRPRSASTVTAPTAGDNGRSASASSKRRQSDRERTDETVTIPVREGTQ